MGRHPLPDFFSRKSGIFVIDVSPCEQADILGESLLLPEVGLVDDTAIAIHLTGENALSAKRAELRKRPMESSDTGKEIYELNCLHVGSLAAKLTQASLGLDFFQPAEAVAKAAATTSTSKPSGPIGCPS